MSKSLPIGLGFDNFGTECIDLVTYSFSKYLLSDFCSDLFTRMWSPGTGQHITYLYSGPSLSQELLAALTQAQLAFIPSQGL